MVIAAESEANFNSEICYQKSKVLRDMDKGSYIIDQLTVQNFGTRLRLKGQIQFLFIWCYECRLELFFGGRHNGGVVELLLYNARDPVRS